MTLRSARLSDLHCCCYNPSDDPFRGTRASTCSIISAPSFGYVVGAGNDGDKELSVGQDA